MFNDQTKTKRKSVKENRRNGINRVSNENNKPRLSKCGFFWNSIPKDKELSISSKDEVEEKPKSKKKKLSAVERQEQKRQKEHEIRQREEALTSFQLQKICGTV